MASHTSFLDELCPPVPLPGQAEGECSAWACVWLQCDTTQPSFSASFVYDAQGYQVQFDVSSNGVGQPGIMGGSVRYANGRVIQIQAVGCRAR